MIIQQCYNSTKYNHETDNFEKKISPILNQKMEEKRKTMIFDYNYFFTQEHDKYFLWTKN